MHINKKISLTRQFLFAAVLVALALFGSSCGKKTQKVYRVGILSGLDYMAEAADGFKAKMTELGYIEGMNIIYDHQKTEFDMAAYNRILKKFIAEKVDLIFVFPTEASLEAKAATKETGMPVVFAVANIEDTGLVDSVREPGGNITGVRYPGPDLAIKRFEIMRELAPNAKRIWIPYQRGYPIVKSQLKALKPAAESLGITLIEFPADDAAEVQKELSTRTASGDIGMDAILFVAEPLAVTPDAFEVIAKFAAEHKLPVGGAYMMVNGFGSIFGVNIETVATGKQAAVLADKILKGTPAGTIPVVSSESFFQINYSVARGLGVRVPEGLLSRADEVIH
ncbi:MAG: ABC transporter substrate-binding protein [Sedimentisphaerales bacterium]|nr:ABC transporter substrate-binding protein [Sedimentisphaerales bacterium]